MSDKTVQLVVWFQGGPCLYLYMAETEARSALDQFAAFVERSADNDIFVLRSKQTVVDCSFAVALTYTDPPTSEHKDELYERYVKAAEENNALLKKMADKQDEGDDWKQRDPGDEG